MAVSWDQEFNQWSLVSSRILKLLPKLQRSTQGLQPLMAVKLHLSCQILYDIPNHWQTFTYQTCIWLILIFLPFDNIIFTFSLSHSFLHFTWQKHPHQKHSWRSHEQGHLLQYRWVFGLLCLPQSRSLFEWWIDKTVKWNIGKKKKRKNEKERPMKYIHILRYLVHF